MEMMMALPIAPVATTKAGAKSSGDKTAGSPFGEILGSTLENVSLPKGKAQAADNTVPQAVLSAMFALLQPTLTNIQSSAQSSTEVMNNAVEPSLITAGEQLTGPAAANEAGPAPGMTVNIPLDPFAPSMIPPAGQPFLADVKAPQNPSNNARQITPDMSAVQQQPVLVNAPGIDKKTDSVEVTVMNDTAAYGKPMDIQAKQDRDRDALALLSNRVLAASISEHQQETGTQHAAAVTMNVVSSREDKPVATNVQQPDTKMPLGVNQKAPEEWQFDSSEYHGEHKPLSEIPSIRNEATANTVLFQSVLEKQSGSKPFEAVSSQPQQQTALADSYGVASQIVEHAKLISRPQNTEMIIKLKPEHLGELTFKVAVEQGTMTATFHSANPEVRNIIETSLPQLKQELGNQGIKLDNVGVFAGMDQFLSGEHRGGQQYQQSEAPLSRRHNNDFAETVTEALQTEPVKNDGGVDYRV